MLASPFHVAFDVAAGRRAAASSLEAAALVPFATRVLQGRRRALDDDPCPGAARHRIRHLFTAPRVPAGLARLLFDSGVGALVTRGRASTRMLRYGGANGFLDLRIKSTSRGDVQMFLSVSETTSPAASVRLVGPSHERHVVLDPFGVGCVEGKDEGAFAVHVYDALGEELFHTPSIAME